jgi:serine/threonine-protein kinase
VLDQGRQIHILDMTTGSMAPFATVGDNERPVWSDNGSRIIFGSTRGGGAMNLWAQAADGTCPVDRLSESPYVQLPAWAAPDGSGVLGSQISPGTAGDIVWFPLKSPSDLSQPSGAAVSNAPPPEPLIHTVGIDYNPDVSPGGHFVAYQSEASGRAEVLVKPFPRVDGGEWRVSEEGGMQPAWARDGTELFYIDLSNVLTAVEVRLAGGRPTFGRRSKLFAVSAGLYGPRPYDPAPDRKFLVVRRDQPDDERDVIVVVLNWFEELKERLPVR